MNIRGILKSPVTRATFGFLMIAAGMQYVGKLAEEKAGELEQYESALTERAAELAALTAQIEQARAVAAELAAAMAATTPAAPEGYREYPACKHRPDTTKLYCAPCPDCRRQAAEQAPADE